jgi:SecD/SecF fusion protein
VAVLVALALFLIHGQGIKQGIDLKGGYVIVFRVLVEEDQEDVAGTVDDVIGVLKNRVDPQGLYSLEWKRLGLNRIEVRMPLGTEASRQARERYRDAMRELERSNIEPSEIRQVVSARGEARREAIARISRSERSAEALREVAEAYDAVSAAEARVTELRREGATAEQINAALSSLREARLVYNNRLEGIDALNVSTRKLGRTLDYYVTDQQEDSLALDVVEERRRQYRQGLEELRERHPGRAEEISEVAAAYRAWVDRRTGLDDPADLKRMVAKAGVLEFRIAPTLPRSPRSPSLTTEQYTRYREELEQDGPLPSRTRNDEYQWFPLRQKMEKISSDLITGEFAGRRYILLAGNKPGMTMTRGGDREWKLAKAVKDRDRLGRPAIGFEFDATGAGIFGDLTGENKGSIMAILLDDEVYSAPTIQAQIFERGIITGSFTPQEQQDLVRTLNAGMLQGRVDPDPVSEKAVAPSLGRDNREAGRNAAILGLIGVAVFMIIYYLYAGAIADLALVLNLVLVLGAVALTSAPLTLPGIAGLILTIGMAVDANVLIFERLREEQAKTQSMKMAIRNAYRNASSAILDGNVTTLLTCLILGWVGTTEVRGFAITLAMGVIFSLFTALVVTRWVFELLADVGVIKSRIPMVAFIGTPKIDWMAKRKFFWVLSVVLVGLGVAAFVSQGSNILGLEFSSGTMASFKLVPGATDDDRAELQERIRRTAEDMAGRAEAGDAQQAQAGAATRPGEGDTRAERLLRLAETARVGTLLQADKGEAALAAYGVEPDGVIPLQLWLDGGADRKVFQRIDADNNGALSADELEEGLNEWEYEVTTSVADVDLLRSVLREALGSALAERSSVTIRGDDIQRSGLVPGLGIRLQPEDGGKIYLSSQLVDQEISSELRERLIDYVGGVMFVIRDADPPLTEQDLLERLQTIRAQPDFEQLQYNRSAVVGLESVEGRRRFRSFAVVAHNPNVDYSARPDQWQAFADSELRLLKEALEREPSLASVTEYDPAIAEQIRSKAVWAVVLSWAAIIAYLWLRFGSFQWGLAAVVCLIHDVVIGLGLVALSAYVYDNVIGRALLLEPFKIDMAMVAAFLTIIGYSVNDTIVVFDRIRENRGRLKTVTEDTINRAINQTVSRTLLTTFTTLIAVVTMYVIGGPGIHAFTYALLVGIIFGTYSSIAVASPMLLGVKHAVVGAVTGETIPAAKK